MLRLDTGYIAPEVLKFGVVGFASDIWSCGILLYVLLTGELPFEPNDESAREAFYENPKRELKLKYRWKKLSRKARSFITEMLVVEPEGRATIGSALQNEWLPGRELNG